jgi:hypothetical protein
MPRPQRFTAQRTVRAEAGPIRARSAFHRKSDSNGKRGHSPARFGLVSAAARRRLEAVRLGQGFQGGVSWGVDTRHSRPCLLVYQKSRIAPNTPALPRQVKAATSTQEQPAARHLTKTPRWLPGGTMRDYQLEGPSAGLDISWMSGLQIPSLAVRYQ